jgi:hypothetical protein
MEDKKINKRLTREDNLVVLDLINTVNNLIREIREGGVHLITFHDVDTLEDKTDEVQKLMKFKSQKSKEDEYPNHWCDRVLPDNTDAWYPKEENV